MKIIKPLIVVFAIILATILGWFLKSEVDNNFFMAGRVHVINTAYEKAKINITFPVGQSFEFDLNKGNSRDLFVDYSTEQNEQKKTEGKIEVIVNGKKLNTDFYIAWHFDLLVISIVQDEAFISRVSNKLNL